MEEPVASQTRHTRPQPVPSHTRARGPTAPSTTPTRHRWSCTVVRGELPGPRPQLLIGTMTSDIPQRIRLHLASHAPNPNIRQPQGPLPAAVLRRHATQPPRTRRSALDRDRHRTPRHSPRPDRARDNRSKLGRPGRFARHRAVRDRGRHDLRAELQQQPRAERGSVPLPEPPPWGGVRGSDAGKIVGYVLMGVIPVVMCFCLYFCRWGGRAAAGPPDRGTRVVYKIRRAFSLWFRS